MTEAEAEAARIKYLNRRFLAALPKAPFGRTIGMKVFWALVMPAFMFGQFVGWLIFGCNRLLGG